MNNATPPTSVGILDDARQRATTQRIELSFLANQLARLLEARLDEFAAGFLMDPVQYAMATAAFQAGSTLLIGMVRQPPNGYLSARFAVEITDTGTVKLLEPCWTPVTPEFAEVARRRSMTEGQLAREVVRSGVAAQ